MSFLRRVRKSRAKRPWLGSRLGGVSTQRHPLAIAKAPSTLGSDRSLRNSGMIQATPPDPDRTSNPLEDESG